MITMTGGAGNFTLAGSFLNGSTSFVPHVTNNSLNALQPDLADFGVALNVLRTGTSQEEPETGKYLALSWWASTLQYVGDEKILKSSLSEIGRRAFALSTFQTAAQRVLKDVEQGKVILQLKKPSKLFLVKNAEIPVADLGGESLMASHPFASMHLTDRGIKAGNRFLGFTTGEVSLKNWLGILKSEKSTDHEKFVALLLAVGTYDTAFQQDQKFVEELADSILKFIFDEKRVDEKLALFAADCLSSLHVSSSQELLSRFGADLFSTKQRSETLFLRVIPIYAQMIRWLTTENPFFDGDLSKEFHVLLDIFANKKASDPIRMEAFRYASALARPVASTKSNEGLLRVMNAIESLAQDPTNIPLIERALKISKADVDLTWGHPKEELDTTAARLLRGSEFFDSVEKGETQKMAALLQLLSFKAGLQKPRHLLFDDIHLSPLAEIRLAKLLGLSLGNRGQLYHAAHLILLMPMTVPHQRILAFLLLLSTRDTVSSEEWAKASQKFGWDLVRIVVDGLERDTAYLAAYLLNHLGPVEESEDFLVFLLDAVAKRSDTDPFLKIQLIRSFRHQIEMQTEQHGGNDWVRKSKSKLLWGLFDIAGNKSLPHSVRLFALDAGPNVARGLYNGSEREAAAEIDGRLKKIFEGDPSLTARFDVSDDFTDLIGRAVFSFRKPDARTVFLQILNDVVGRPPEGLQEELGSSERKQITIEFSMDMSRNILPRLSWGQRAFYSVVHAVTDLW